MNKVLTIFKELNEMGFLPIREREFQLKKQVDYTDYITIDFSIIIERNEDNTFKMKYDEGTSRTKNWITIPNNKLTLRQVELLVDIIVPKYQKV